MSEIPGTVIALRGTSGAGKTALVRAMQAGDHHLIDIPLLRRAMNLGFTFTEVGELTSQVQAGKPLWPVLRAKLDCAPFAVVETCVTHKQVSEELPDDVALYNAYCVAPPWMVLARRRARYIMDGRATPANIGNHWAYTRWQKTVPGPAEVTARSTDPGELVLIDTTDYPVRQVTLDEATALLGGAFSFPKTVDCCFNFPDDSAPTTHYQQGVRVSGNWFGTPITTRQDFEWARLNAVLPERMDGMTVLDVGAMEGGFCFEALNRGAVYCMAVDILPAPMQLLKTTRTMQWQPISTAMVNIDTQELPRLNDLYDRRPYDLALLLNVLHRTEKPKVALKRVLGVCNSAVIEAPFWVGTHPVRPDEALYPGTWHLPPLWIKEIAERCGFQIESIAVDPYCGAQRLVYKLRRRGRSPKA